MPNRRSKTKRRGANRPRGNRTSAISHPPQFVSTKRTSGRARYIAIAAATDVTVTRGNLLNHLVMNSASGTANYRLFAAFRLKSVEIWAMTPTLGSTVTASVEWTSANGPSTIHSDTCLGTAEPAHVMTRPPPQALSSFWSLSGSNESEVLCILNAPSGAVVDITYDAVLQNGEASVLATTTANGVIGQVYMTYLNGVTTVIFAPRSYNALT